MIVWIAGLRLAVVLIVAGFVAISIRGYDPDILELTDTEDQ